MAAVAWIRRLLGAGLDTATVDLAATRAALDEVIGANGARRGAAPPD